MIKLLAQAPRQYSHAVTLGISCGGHLLLLFLIMVVWLPPLHDEPKPALYIPAYMASATSAQPPAAKSANQSVSPPVKAVASSRPSAASVAAAATKTSRSTQAIVSRQSSQVHLLGDKKLDKSLYMVLGKALAAHLVYPKIAEDFQLRGVVLIGFTLDPSGKVSNARVVKTSQIEVLDAAALQAVQAISPVANIGSYVQETQNLVVGVIFG